MKLKAPSNRVIIKVDLESKNSHTFKDGTKLKLERVYDNFNMRYVKPVNAEVVDADGTAIVSNEVYSTNSTTPQFVALRGATATQLERHGFPRARELSWS
jgi:hypothetical protein